MSELPHLIAATDRKGRFSGYYKCSLCVAEFRPNPRVPEELSKTFDSHVRLSHCADMANSKKLVPPNERIAQKRYRENR